MSGTTVVTRFAPSPTGYLHVGGARTALFNWLLARHLGGKFLLRIEDTDLARSTEQATSQLVDDLKWLGLNWDNSELVYQSRRTAVYNALIDRLIVEGKAYKAWESPEELDVQRKAAERMKRAYIYKRPKLSDAQIKELEASGKPHVVRFAMPLKEYRFHDVVLDKEILLAPSQVQDFVIRKTDGMPTYHFAVVVDDADMGITHILRGQEHLLNTINHIALQDALGYPRPTYGHLSIIMNVDGSKMSKRDRDKKVRVQAGNWMRNNKKSAGDLAQLAGLAEERVKLWIEDDTKQLDLDEQPRIMKVVGLRESDLPEIMIHDFRKNGYLPEVLNNFLALLGWSPGGDRERMSMDDLVKLFGIDGIGKSNAKFGRDKLLAFNTEACSAGGEKRMIAAMRDYLAANPDSPLGNASDEQLARVLKMNAGFHILREVDDKSRFFFIPDEKVAYEKEAIDKVLLKNDKQGLHALNDVASEMQNVTDWTAHNIETLVKGYCERTKLGLGKVAQPIRVAVSGSSVSPPIFESLELLGKTSALARIARCVSMCG